MSTAMDFNTYYTVYNLALDSTGSLIWKQPKLCAFVRFTWKDMSRTYTCTYSSPNFILGLAQKDFEPYFFAYTYVLIYPDCLTYRFEQTFLAREEAKVKQREKEEENKFLATFLHSTTTQEGKKE